MKSYIQKKSSRFSIEILRPLAIQFRGQAKDFLVSIASNL